MSDARLPRFLQPGGAQTYPQPLDLRDCHLFSFVLAADGAALARICDTYLNGPAQGQATYVPAASCAMLIVAMIGRISCVNLPPEQQFWLPETDIAFWVPVVKGKKDGGVFVAESLQWFLPYVFVNNTWAVASGREIYGYPKAISSFQLPAHDNPNRFTVDTLTVKAFGPDAEATWQRLFQIDRTSAPGGLFKRTFNSVVEAGEAILRTAIAERMLPIPGLGMIKELFDLIVHGTMPMVFLKQFRDATDGTTACYQAVVEAPAQVTRFRKAGEIAADYGVTIQSYASHPIVADLGLRGNVDPDTGAWRGSVESAWYGDFDFQVLNATGTSPK
ncbi:MAG: acetoacetate decarboxylase family protein [Isosphaeraceae bacterium]